MFIVVMGTTMYMSYSLSCYFKTKIWLTESELSIIADGRSEEFESRIVLRGWRAHLCFRSWLNLRFRLSEMWFPCVSVMYESIILNELHMRCRVSAQCQKKCAAICWGIGRFVPYFHGYRAYWYRPNTYV